MRGKKATFSGILCFILSTEMQEKICAVYGEDALTDGTFQKWFAVSCWRFLTEWDLPRSGRPVEVDSDQMETLGTINVVPHEDSWTYSKYPNQTLEKICGYVHSFDVWIPHKLRKKTPNKPKTTLLAGISTCVSLIKCNKTVLFLKQLMTGHEKWILYNNVDWRRSWGKRNELPPTTPEARLHPKVMLCLQWDWKGVL